MVTMFRVFLFKIASRSLYTEKKAFMVEKKVCCFRYLETNNGEISMVELCYVKIELIKIELIYYK